MCVCFVCFRNKTYYFCLFQGPESESLTYGVVDGRLLLFIGNERPGIVSVYSVANDITRPRFETLYDGISDVTETHEKLYEQRKVNAIDPEDIRYNIYLFMCGRTHAHAHAHTHWHLQNLRPDIILTIQLNMFISPKA